LVVLTRLHQLVLSDSTTIKINPVLVRTAVDLSTCDALILPGGESTTIALLARVSGLLEPLREFVRNPDKAVWGTCAGAILMAEHGVKKGQKQGGQDLFGGVNIVVERNGWGGQVSELVDRYLY
jgi:pyridoxal 5'-phosphate synthase pdxT subunit